MTTRSKPAVGDRGYLAVVRRFPHAELAIRRLIIHNETFREMCEELAEAETVLSTVSGATPEIEVRKREWQELVDRLASEVAASLRTVNH